MPAIAIREITIAGRDRACAFAIRRRVFVEEQGVSEALEFDGLDEEARHLLASVDGEPAGTLRIRLLEGGRVAKIERVAVLAAQRRHRVGRALMVAALRSGARARRGARPGCMPRRSCRRFTPGSASSRSAATFEEDGIAHIAMGLSLAAPTGAASGTGRR